MSDVAIIEDPLTDQYRLPRGRLAAVAARNLNRRNRELIHAAVAALDVQAGQRVLDVGFGGGLSLHLLLQRADLQVSGVEPSPELVERAERIFKPAVEADRLSVRIGSATTIPFPDESFDRVLTCQTVYFWDDVRAGLTEVRRVLAPSGRVALAVMPLALQEQFRFGERGYHVVDHDELREWLQDAGFDAIGTWPPHSGESWIVTAHKP